MSNSNVGLKFDRRSMVILVLPLVFEQLLVVTMGFADTFMVAGVGEAAVSGVSLVDQMNMLIQQVLAALATGGAVVTSQYLGMRKGDNAAHSAAQLFSIVLMITMTLLCLGMAGNYLILRFIFGQIDSEVMGFARTYFFISVISYPFIGLYSSGTALFRAQGNTKISMKTSLVMNVINLSGNAFLIYGLHMGVLGAALATLAGRMFAAIWVTWKWQQKNNPLRMEKLNWLKTDAKTVKKILSIGIPSGIENGMFHLGKLLVFSLVSTLGTASIAANAVANSVTSVANVPGNAMGMTAIPVVGQLLGAGEKKKAKRYGGYIIATAMTGLLFTDLLLFISIPVVARWYNLSDEAMRLCVQVSRWFAVFAIFSWAGSFTMPNILRAGGDAKFTMTVSIISMWSCRVVLSYVCVKHLGIGLLGVWLGMLIDWCVRAVCFWTRFCSEKWMNHKVV